MTESTLLQLDLNGDDPDELPRPIDDDLDAIAPHIINFLHAEGGLSRRVQRLNALRRLIAEHSPFAGEPVDVVEWMPSDDVHANDYNPNMVAPPEMELLRLSILADGYTQPIVTAPDDGGRVVIDGFHRCRVGKEMPDVTARVHGYLPVVKINAERADRGDRIAATIRHNRARGKHRIDAMTDIVVELKSRHWSDERIGRELGMEPDEVLRLCQISGLSELFSDEEFSASWDAVSDSDEFAGFDEDQCDTVSPSGVQDLERIYHTVDKWECYKAGFFEHKLPERNLSEGVCKMMFANFLRDIPRFEQAMERVLTEWPTSCEQWLLNERMNRIAWLGQAAACIDMGMPAIFCNGFNQLSSEEQQAADLAALKYLNKWLGARGLPTLATLADAQRRTQPELY